jgi:hypothetical protein
MTKWDREVARIVGPGFWEKSRECVTSPTPSMCSSNSTASVQERLQANKQSMHELLYDKSPFRRRAPAAGTRTRRSSSRPSSRSALPIHPYAETSRSALPIHPYAETEASVKDAQLQTLQNKIAEKQKQLQRFRRKLEFAKTKTEHTPRLATKQSEYVAVKLGNRSRVMSPDSPPDSAIDMETSSVRSALSIDRTSYASNNMSSTNNTQRRSSREVSVNGLGIRDDMSHPPSSGGLDSDDYSAVLSKYIDQAYGHSITDVHGSYNAYDWSLGHMLGWSGVDNGRHVPEWAPDPGTRVTSSGHLSEDLDRVRSPYRGE